jgi:hypothetical protein
VQFAPGQPWLKSILVQSRGEFVFQAATPAGLAQAATVGPSGHTYACATGPAESGGAGDPEMVLPELPQGRRLRFGRWELWRWPGDGFVGLTISNAALAGSKFKVALSWFGSLSFTSDEGISTTLVGPPMLVSGAPVGWRVPQPELAVPWVVLGSPRQRSTPAPSVKQEDPFRHRRLQLEKIESEKHQELVQAAMARANGIVPGVRPTYQYGSALSVNHTL